MGRMMQVAVEDEVVCGVFISVMHMCAPPTALFAPEVLRRVLFPRRATAVREAAARPLSDAAE